MKSWSHHCFCWVPCSHWKMIHTWTAVLSETLGSVLVWEQNNLLSNKGARGREDLIQMFLFHLPQLPLPILHSGSRLQPAGSHHQGSKPNWVASGKPTARMRCQGEAKVVSLGNGPNFQLLTIDVQSLWVSWVFFSFACIRASSMFIFRGWFSFKGTALSLEVLGSWQKP